MRCKIFQQWIHHRINATQKKAGNRGHTLQGLAQGRTRLQTGKIGIHDLLVARHPEQQRHVDVNAFGDQLLDDRQSFGGGGDLDEHIRPFQSHP